VNLLKSKDGGTTWSTASSGLTGVDCTGVPPVLSLAIDPKNSSTLYATTHTGLFKSTDGGASWAAAGSGLPDHLPDGRPFYSAGAMVIDPQNPSTLYAAMSLPGGLAGGVFKSSDGGATWVAANSGLPGTAAPFIRFLAIDPKHPDTLYAISDGTTS
jgi:photosystem II stability/assembly factor-like uncharacterized protein